MRSARRLTFDDYLIDRLQEPEFRAGWDETAPAYELKRLRILKKLSQAELARQVGTKQPSIARLENGYGFRNLTFVKKVAEALDAQVEIRITPKKPGAQSKSTRKHAKSATKKTNLRV